jgi:hypothetical protein
MPTRIYWDPATPAADFYEVRVAATSSGPYILAAVVMDQRPTALRGMRPRGSFITMTLRARMKACTGYRVFTRWFGPGYGPVSAPDFIRSADRNANKSRPQLSDGGRPSVHCSPGRGDPRGHDPGVSEAVVGCGAKDRGAFCHGDACRRSVAKPVLARAGWCTF